MSVAWTTILIIVLLLPGVFFLIGLAARERHSHEVVRSSAVGDLGAAILFAIVLHLIAWTFLSIIFGFDLSFYFRPLADFDHEANWVLWDQIVNRLWPVSIYIIATAIFGWIVGFLLAGGVISGHLRFMATHKWVYEIVKFSNRKRGVVTAYVMTNTTENNQALMYKGLLQEFYLTSEGRFAYVVMRNCTKFYMSFADNTPKTGEQLSLFGAERDQTSSGLWNYLMIDGENIANILFDRSPEIRQTNKGQRALEEALRQAHR